MNDAKSTITLLACCCIVLTIAPSASADFVGVTTVIKDDPDTANLCGDPKDPPDPFQGVTVPLTVCNVFAVFDDPDDTFLGVGNAELQVYNGANPDVFFQHPANNDFPLTYSCGLLDIGAGCCNFCYCDLICDSFITIGLECRDPFRGERSDGTTPDGDFCSDEFGLNGHIVGGWFNEDLPNGQGDAGNYPDLQVLFLQSSVEVGLSMSGVIDVSWKNAAGDTIQELGIPVECAAECGSCPTDTDGDGNTDAADLAVLLGSWGPVDAGECLDNDSSGSIEAFDLAVLLGAWGPCQE